MTKRIRNEEIELADQSGSAEAADWDSIAELSAGVRPEDVEPLVAVRELGAVFPLLHSLMGRSPRDFYVRAAAIESLVTSDRASFSAEDLREVLYWLSPEARDSVLRALRQTGWLEYDPRTGTSVTNAGKWIFDILSFLHRRLEEGELLPTLAGVEYALEVGVDPVRHLLSMRSRLVALREEMEMARASHSEVVLRHAAERLQEGLSLSAQIRAVLDRIPTANPSTRRIVRDIHDLLSRLHGVGADLQAAITEVGRQYIRLTAGLTVEQIVRALMGQSPTVLSEVGAQALLPAYVPQPFLTTEVVAFAAEGYVLRERHEVEELKWSEPAEPEREIHTTAVAPEITTWIDDLVGVAEKGIPAELDGLIPRNSSGESFLRASLLPLVGSGHTGKGAAGQIGSLSLELVTEPESWPVPLAGSPLSGLTRGRVQPGRDK